MMVDLELKGLKRIVKSMNDKCDYKNRTREAFIDLLGHSVEGG